MPIVPRALAGVAMGIALALPILQRLGASSMSMPFIRRAIILASFFCGASFAEDYIANFTKPLPPDQSIIFENTNLKAIDFLNAMISGTIAERRYAELYFLGVLDATEGSTWCNYKTYKTITIDERVFVNLKRLPREELDGRASTAIKHILSREFPCGSPK